MLDNKKVGIELNNQEQFLNDFNNQELKVVRKIDKISNEVE